MNFSEMLKKVASNAFDESIKVIKDGKHPVEAASSVKKHAEKAEKQYLKSMKK
jgi:hypothetical protein